MMLFEFTLNFGMGEEFDEVLFEVSFIGGQSFVGNDEGSLFVEPVFGL